ncbi:hypothetical protein [Streptomyces sp. NPDC058872]|uniref:hypothetical protein n=1 Tax=Streptomyces sp. NPDC058872 TaxID=3346661 RepID=UPI0036B8673A
MPIVLPWEQAVLAIGAKTENLTGRNDVMGERWLDQKRVDVMIVPGNGETQAARYDISHVIPLNVPERARYSQYSCVVGFQVPWKRMLNNPDSKFNRFHSDGMRSLGALAVTPHNSGVASFSSFTEAVQVIHDVNAWLQKWLPILKSWEEGIDSDDSEWKGSAAGSFKKFLHVIYMEMRKVQIDLAQIRGKSGQAPPSKLDLSGASGYEALLSNAETQLRATAWNMYRGLHLWLWPEHSKVMNPQVSPVSLMHEVFAGLLKKGDCRFDWQLEDNNDTNENGHNSNTTYDPGTPSVYDDSGSLITNEFWIDGIEIVAKQKWITYLQSSLDELAKTEIGHLDLVYLELGSALGEGIYTPRFQMPTGGAGAGPEAPPGTGGSGAGGGSWSGGPSGGPSGIDDLLGDNKNGDGSKDGSPGGKDPGDPRTGLPAPPPPTLPSTLPGSGTGGKTNPLPPGALPPSTLPGSGTPGGKVPLLDKNGKPVTGADGKPVMVPPGSRIGKDGKVYDSAGKPVTGSNGKQLVAPPGGKVGQPQPDTTEQPHTLPGSGYNQIRLPEGAKILPDGTIVDAKGKQLLDSNGNPYALPKGATIKDGIVVGADGKSISRTYQLLTNAEHALASRPTPNVTTGGPDGTGGLPGRSGSGLVGDLGPGGLPKSLAGTSSSGGSTLLGDRAARSLGLTPSGTGVTAPAGAGGVGPGSTSTGGGPDTAGATGTGGTQTGQPPMMPPMNPGAAGAGQPNQGKDRQRTTWLTEDEETWGTDTGSVSGVIGR